MLNSGPIKSATLTSSNSSGTHMDNEIEIEAAVFRRLLEHLDKHKGVQNIELMNLASFCRNCLAKWYVSAAESRGVEIGYEQARHRIYGMPYAEWKEKFQTPATAEQMKVFKEKHP